MILAVAALTVFWSFVIFWAHARLRERRLRDEWNSRPRCKHGRDKLRGPKCEECYEETRAYFEEKERKDHPLYILPPTTVGSTISFVPGDTFFASNKFYFHPNTPRKGQWWTPIACKKNPEHAASIPVFIDWSPTIHEQLRVKCGCLISGQVTPLSQSVLH